MWKVTVVKKNYKEKSQVKNFNIYLIFILHIVHVEWNFETFCNIVRCEIIRQL